MIDDDFESVFRRMIEQFMEAFGELPEGSMNIRSWSGSIVNKPIETQIDSKATEPLVETIDFEDSALILIQGLEETEIPTVKVSGSTIAVKHGPERNEITVEVGFIIDIEKSDVSYRNGVMEISAVMADENAISNDGFLRVD